MKTYRTVQGDTWDIIAKNVYGDEKKMDVIMQANFGLLDYVVFPAGIELNIPETVSEPVDNLPIWRQ